MENGEQKNDRSIGALWAKSSKKGMYYSGTLEIDGRKIPIVCFQNYRKSKPNQPDFNIMIAQPMGERAPVEEVDKNLHGLNNLDTSSQADDGEVDLKDIPF